MTKIEIAEKLKKLTSEGVKISKIEKETKFTKNGLSAVIAGHKLIPTKWLPIFEKYLAGVEKKEKPITNIKLPDAKDLTEMFSASKIKERQEKFNQLASIQAYCDANGLKLDDLPNYMDKLRLERDAAISSLNALKLKVEKKGWLEPDQPLKLGNSDFAPSKFMEERRNLKNGVKTKTEKKETAD